MLHHLVNNPNSSRVAHIDSINKLAKEIGYDNSGFHEHKLSENIKFETLKCYSIENSRCRQYFCKAQPDIEDVKNFITEYERSRSEPKEVPPAGGDAPDRPGLVPLQSNPRPSPPNNVLLVKGPPQAPEPSKIKGLAAIQLVTAQIGRGTADIGFEISCGQSSVAGRPVTIRMGLMTWDCGGGELDPETRKGRGAPYQANANVKLEWNGADTFKPMWRVEAEGASIGNLDVPPDFGTVRGLSPGCTITATFGVWRPDIEEAEVADINAAITVLDAISIPGDPGSPAELSKTKRNILLKLATHAIELEGDFIVLCRHTVTFVAGETE